MARPPELTDPAIDLANEETTDIDHSVVPEAVRAAAARAGSFRDEPTAAAETRTVNLGRTAPWLATPEPEPRPARPRDPLFWPAVVFVGVLAISIVFVLLRPSPHSNGSRPSGSFASP